MKKTIGSILSTVGLIGVLYYGLKYLNDSDFLNFFGVDVAISTGDYVPVLVFAIILILGLLIYRSN